MLHSSHSGESAATSLRKYDNRAARSRLFQKSSTTRASRKHERKLRSIRSFLTSWTLFMRRRPIRIEIFSVQPLFTDFHAHTVYYFKVLGSLASLPGIMKRVPLSEVFPTDAIQLKEAKVSQLDGNCSFTLDLRVNIWVSLMVMW
jgi:hypothetical protein